MNHFLHRYGSIVLPIANDIVRSGFLDPDDSDKWARTQHRLLVRYADTLDWDIPYLVEVDGWANGAARFHWILWPTSPDVSFPRNGPPINWPGDAWGTGFIDTDPGFRLGSLGNYHLRKSRRQRIDDIDSVSPDTRFTAAPSLLKH